MYFHHMVQQNELSKIVPGNYRHSGVIWYIFGLTSGLSPTIVLSQPREKKL